MALVSTSSGVVQGYAAVRPTGEVNFRLNLMVDPAWQRKEIGRSLLAQVENALVALGAVSVQVRVRADLTTGVSFALSSGYDEIHRMVGMSLDLRRLDHARLRPDDAVAEHGEIRFTDLGAEMSEDPEWVRKLHELHVTTLESWPNDDPYRPNRRPSLEDFDNFIAENGGPPERFQIAAAGGDYVGYCSSLGTAVHPAWRGRGIAKSLKVRQIHALAAAGEKTLFSSSAHPTIITINRELGYREGHTEVRLVNVPATQYSSRLVCHKIGVAKTFEPRSSTDDSKYR